MADKREYDNPFDDYVAHRETNTKVIYNGMIHPDFVEKLKASVNALLPKLSADLEIYDGQDYSIYTGTCGIALLYLLVSSKHKNPDYVTRALQIVEKSLPMLKNHRISFLTGDSGPLALGAVLYHMKGMPERKNEMLHRLKEFLPLIMNLKSDLPDEVLYGRAGYLCSLLFVNKCIGPDTIDSETIKKVVSALLLSGNNLSRLENHNVPLMYKWHGKYYIGAAHGLCGILYLILQARNYLTQANLDELVRPTLDYLQSMRFESGNFPSSLGHAGSLGSDRLVQWCHGAPGAVHLFALAYEVFYDENYLKTAIKCGEVVWNRGLLRKGYSICHGVAGNAYTFLVLYQLTGDSKYLYRACKFAEWCTSYGKNQSRMPDRPLSLFEGVAGAIYYLLDVQTPDFAEFPAFTFKF